MHLGHTLVSIFMSKAVLVLLINLCNVKYSTLSFIQRTGASSQSKCRSRRGRASKSRSQKDLNGANRRPAFVDRLFQCEHCWDACCALRVAGTIAWTSFPAGPAGPAGIFSWQLFQDCLWIPAHVDSTIVMMIRWELNVLKHTLSYKIETFDVESGRSFRFSDTNSCSDSNIYMRILYTYLALVWPPSFNNHLHHWTY